MKILRSTRKEIRSEGGAVYQLAYHLITAQKLSEDGSMVQTYGIRVEKFSGKTILASEEFSDITRKAIEMERLFVVLSECTVTPMCLREVLEDYLA